jgi:hypothetical protein
MMNLKTFVAETLKEIIDGVVEAGQYYVGKGGEVNSLHIVYRNSEGSQLMDRRNGQIAQMVEFDVALTAAEGTETKGGIGVFAGAVGLGSQGKSDSSNSSVSRVKFSVPILLPTLREK